MGSKAFALKKHYYGRIHLGCINPQILNTFESANSGKERQPFGEHNTTKDKIYQDIAKEIFDFIYEGEETAAIMTPETFISNVSNIIVDKLHP